MIATVKRGTNTLIMVVEGYLYKGMRIWPCSYASGVVYPDCNFSNLTFYLSPSACPNIFKG